MDRSPKSNGLSRMETETIRKPVLLRSKRKSSTQGEYHDIQIEQFLFLIHFSEGRVADNHGSDFLELIKSKPSNGKKKED